MSRICLAAHHKQELQLGRVAQGQSSQPIGLAVGAAASDREDHCGWGQRQARCLQYRTERWILLKADLMGWGEWWQLKSLQCGRDPAGVTQGMTPVAAVAGTRGRPGACRALAAF